MNKIKIYIVLLLVAFSVNNLIAVEPLPKPEPKTAKDFVFPEYKTIVLSNGIKVFLISDKEQPVIELRMLLAGGSNLDGAKTGLSDITTGLMTKGAGKRNALEIAQTLDGIGASVSVSAGQDYIIASGSSLTKHFSAMFDVFTDVVLNPKFPKDEFDKLIEQSLAGVKMRKSNSGQLSRLLGAIAVYGKDHPYGKVSSEPSLKSITIDDCKKYYQSTFMPNNLTMAVIGDFDEKELIKALEGKFKSWKLGSKPNMDLPDPKPLPKGVYFIPRAGSKQSSVTVTALTIPRNHSDNLALRLTSAVLGGGFGSKLFRTLREKYSFTYSPFASHTGNKYANRFTAGSEVKLDKTDSSITVIMEQVNALYNDGVTDEELGRIKNNVIGNYQMAFESSDFVASLIQNSEFYGESMDVVKTYTTRMNNLTTFDIAKVSEKYLRTDKLYVTVVTTPEMKDELKKWGNVYEYTLDLESEEDIARANPVNITAEELIQKYTNAMGGAEKINAIQTMKLEARGKFKVQGQSFDAKATQLTKFPDKEFRSITTPVFQQESWCNGTKAWAKQGTELVELTGADFDDAKKNVKSELLELTKAIQNKFKLELIGEKDGLIKLKVTNSDGDKATYYFDKANFLIKKMEATQDSPQGPIEVVSEYSQYESIDGMKYPLRVVVSTPFYQLELDNVVFFNVPIEDDVFTPNK